VTAAAIRENQRVTVLTGPAHCDPDRDVKLRIDLEIRNGQGLCPATCMWTFRRDRLIRLDASYSREDWCLYGGAGTRGPDDKLRQARSPQVWDRRFRFARDEWPTAPRSSRDQLTVFINFEEQTSTRTARSPGVRQRQPEPVQGHDELELSVRATNCL
jgi:DNA-directed RNA polymerase subunit alpha